MKSIRRIMSCMMVAVLTLCLFSGAMAEGKKQIGLIIQKENGAFLDMKEGILQTLEEAGYPRESVDYQCAQGDATTLATICNTMDGYDLVFTIATPATQQFVNMESETPAFFCAVSAPVAAGVVTTMEEPDRNATGTSNAIPVDNIFELANALTPGITCYGLIYSTSETNAVNTVVACMSYLDAADIKYVAKTVTSSADVASVTEALISDGCDAIFVPNDSNVQAGVSALAEICMEYRVPTYCSSATTVASGCLATVAIDDVGIGRKTADMALEYLSGTAVESIPAVVVSADYVSINAAMAEALGLELTAESIQVNGADYAVNYME